jgi:hypothetical protein
VLQLVLVGYTFAGIHGGLGGIGGATGDASWASLGWVDRAAAGDVVFHDNATERREEILRNTTFWNDDVKSLYATVPLPPAPFPVNAMPLRGGEIGPDLSLSEAPPGRLAVQSADSPLWQADGRRLASRPDDGLELIEGDGRARWQSRGLDADAQVPLRRIALAARGGRLVTVTFTGPAPEGRGELGIRLGSRERRLRLRGGAVETVTFDLCGESGVVTGAIDPVAGSPIDNGRTSAGRIVRVRVAPCG